MEIFVDKSGKNRKGTKIICKSCKIEFITRLDQPQKYCSVLCRSQGQTNKVELICNQCGVGFKRAKSKSLKDFVFCTRKCKDEAQRIGGIIEIMPDHYGTGKSDPRTYRSLYRRVYGLDKLSCNRCGYSEFECGIDIHHINGNHQDNSKMNLISICSPCHRALHNELWFLYEITGNG